MATFTITTDTNIDECTSKGGGDVYNISDGATLTIDQDSRYGLNGTTSASIERIGIATATGGTCLIDGRYVRLIPFTGGSGTLTLGATIDCGSASGEAIGIYANLTSAPGTTGSSGYLKIKAWNGIAYPTSGEFTKGGFTFTINGADVAGWIEILTDEGAGSEPALMITVPYLGALEMRGAWYELGDTNGSAGQTFQIPSNGSAVYVPGIFIEKTDGEGDFEFYANAATATGQATDIRAKICWIATTGVVTLGHDGSNPAGYTPASGLRVVVPNIITSHCATGDRTANVIPNATLANRFQLGRVYSGSNGTYLIDKANLAWYSHLDYQNSVTITDSGIFDHMRINGAVALDLDTVGIGCSADLAVDIAYISNCNAGTIQNLRGWRGSFATIGLTCARLTGCVNLTVSGVLFGGMREPAAGYIRALLITMCTDCSLDDVTVIGGSLSVSGSTGTRISDLHFACSVDNTTSSSYDVSGVYITGASVDTVIDGLDFLGLENVHPYNTIFNLDYNVNGALLCNVGSYASPLSCGSANASGYLATLHSVGAGNRSVAFRRCYITLSRSGFVGDRFESFGTSVWNSGDDYDQAARPACNDADWRGVKCSGQLGTADTLVGTHFWDAFTSTTAGRIVLVMHPPSTASADRVAVTGSAWWTGANGLHLDTEGDTATWTDNVFRIGHTGFDGAPVMAGGTASNYLIEYGIDLNDGAGWTEWEEATEAHLEARNASIDATLGFKMRVRITTTTGNTSAITSLYFATTSTTTTQEYTYKLYETTVTVHAIDATTLGNIAGAAVRLEAGAGGEYVAGTALGSGTTDTNGLCKIVVSHDAAQLVTGWVRRGTTTPFYVQGILHATIEPGDDATLTVALTRED